MPASSGGTGSSFDFIRQQRDFLDHETRIKKLEGAGADPLAEATFPVAVYRQAIVAAGSSLPADTDATHDSGQTLVIPQSKVRIGGRLDVRLCVACVVNAFPWSFQLELFDGTNAFPMHDVVSPEDPGDANLVILADFTASFWLNGSSLELAGMGTVAYHAAAGTTPPLGGVGALSDFSPPLRALAADLSLTPRLTVTGSAVGNTFTVQRYEAAVYDQFT